MRIPITGNPSLDAYTVRIAHAALKAQAVVDRYLARLQRQATTFRLRAWVKSLRSRALRARRKAESDKRRQAPHPARF